MSMTFASISDSQISQLREELAKSDERIKIIDKELQRVAKMVEKLYELRYHKAPPPIKRSVSLDAAEFFVNT